MRAWWRRELRTWPALAWTWPEVAVPRTEARPMPLYMIDGCALQIVALWWVVGTIHTGRGGVLQSLTK